MDSLFRLLMFSTWYWGRYASPFSSWPFIPGEPIVDFEQLDVNAAITHLKTAPELSADEIQSALHSAYQRQAALARQIELTQANLLRIEKLLRRLDQ
jgi:hypothetical protein